MITILIDQGKIIGTRITVQDVFYYQQAGRKSDEIADILGLTNCQVTAALEYIQDHEEEVRAVHAKVESRIECGNSLEVEGKRQASKAKVAAWREQHKKTQEANGERHPGGR